MCVGPIDLGVKVTIWVYSTILAYLISYQKWDPAF